MTMASRIKKLEAVGAPAQFEPYGCVIIGDDDDAEEAIREKYGDDRPAHMMIVRLVSSRHYAGDPRCGCRDCKP